MLATEAAGGIGGRPERAKQWSPKTRFRRICSSDQKHIRLEGIHPRGGSRTGGRITNPRNPVPGQGCDSLTHSFSSISIAEFPLPQPAEARGVTFGLTAEDSVGWIGVRVGPLVAAAAGMPSLAPQPRSSTSFGLSPSSQRRRRALKHPSLLVLEHTAVPLALGFVLARHHLAP